MNQHTRLPNFSTFKTCFMRVCRSRNPVEQGFYLYIKKVTHVIEVRNRRHSKFLMPNTWFSLITRWEWIPAKQNILKTSDIIILQIPANTFSLMYITNCNLSIRSHPILQIILDDVFCRKFINVHLFYNQVSTMT